MEFGPVPPASAVGGILAHSLRVGGTTIRKGRVLTKADVEDIAKEGFTDITIARLGPDDVTENNAAERIARALSGKGIRVGAAFTGRANLYAEDRGLARIGPATIAALNSIDEAITIATVSPFERV